MFYFNNPQSLNYLWLVLALAVLVYLHKRWVAITLRKIGSSNGNQLFSKRINSHLGWPQLVLLTGFTLLIMAMAEPVSNNGRTQKNVSGRQFIFCLDISNSMNAKDVAPSRLEATKSLIKKIVEQHDGENFGLILFAGNAYVDVPITDDVTSLLNNLSVINSDMAPTQGTAIADALIAACSNFQEKLNGQKTIVLITDGEDHDSKISKAIDEINNEEIYCAAIGLGTTDGAEVLDEQGGAVRNDEGKQVLSKLNEGLLKKIADNTNGHYEVYDNSNSLLNSFNSLMSNMQKGSSRKSAQANLQHWYQLPLSLGLVFLLVYFLSNYFKLKAK